MSGRSNASISRAGSVMNSPGSSSMTDEARVFRKLRKHVLARGANGVPVLGPSYLMLERDVSGHASPRNMGPWDVKRFVRKADMSSMSEADIDVWVRTRATNNDEVVDAVALLVDLRLELHCTQQQIDDIIRKVRCNKNAAGMSPIQRVNGVLSLPEKYFLLHYLEGDMEYLADLLADQIPVDIVYPCLLNKLIDAVIVVDNGKAHTGTLGILKCFKFAPLLDKTVFKRCMKDFQCGLGDGEIDSLFGFVAETVPEASEPIVRTASFIRIVREKLSSMAFCTDEDNIQRIAGKVQGLMRRNPMTFPLILFHNEVSPLLTSEDADDDILRFCEILRSHGIIGVPDIDMELLWCYLRATRLGIVEVLADDAKPVREEAMEHAYTLLDSVCQSSNQPLMLSYLIQNFRVPPRYPSSFSTSFATFFNVFNRESSDLVSKEAFQMFWRCASFSVDTDGEFSMLMWASLQLSRIKGRMSK